MLKYVFGNNGYQGYHILTDQQVNFSLVQTKTQSRGPETRTFVLFSLGKYLQIAKSLLHVEDEEDFLKLYGAVKIYGAAVVRSNLTKRHCSTLLVLTGSLIERDF